MNPVSYGLDPATVFPRTLASHCTNGSNSTPYCYVQSPSQLGNCSSTPPYTNHNPSTTKKRSSLPHTLQPTPHLPCLFKTFPLAISSGTALLTPSSSEVQFHPYFLFRVLPKCNQREFITPVSVLFQHMTVVLTTLSFSREGKHVLFIYMSLITGTAPGVFIYSALTFNFLSLTFHHPMQPPFLTPKVSVLICPLNSLLYLH